MQRKWKKRLFEQPLVFGLAIALMLGGCSSRPKAYRKARPCNCPTWGHVEAPGKSGDVGTRPVKAPYYCGGASRS